jgi:hypothetical protein
MWGRRKSNFEDYRLRILCTELGVLFISKFMNRVTQESATTLSGKPAFRKELRACDRLLLVAIELFDFLSNGLGSRSLTNQPSGGPRSAHFVHIIWTKQF